MAGQFATFQSIDEVMAGQFAATQSSLYALADQFTVPSCSALRFTLGSANSIGLGLESAFKSFESFKTRTSSSTISPSLNPSKLLAARNLNSPQLKISKKRDLDYIYTQ